MVTEDQIFLHSSESRVGASTARIPLSSSMALHFVAAVVFITIGWLMGCEPAVAGEIHTIAASGDILAMKELLNSKNVRIDEREPGGMTPLIIASMHGRKNMAAYLLSRGADVSIHDICGRSALFWAARYGAPDVVRLLVENRAVVNDPDELGWTPLHAAAMMRNNEAVSLLIAKKAYVFSRDINGKTPLELAQYFEWHDTAKILRRYGVKEPSPVMTVISLGGLAIFLAGYGWILAMAFILNVWWGLACIFMPCVAPFFCSYNG
ncbi:MAG: ankyrin repeat domain-containing protein [Vulcanimicrobiota bacterium]